MSKLFNLKYLGIGSAAVVMGALVTWAAVSVSGQPVSLVTTDLKVKAQSVPVGLVRFGLGVDAGETLSSVSVTINNNGTSAATGADLANVALYRDDGDNILEAGSDDLLVGSQTSVNVGSATSVTAASNHALPGTFFITLATSASWSDANPADSVTVNLAAAGIVTSANSPTVTGVSTSTITADTTGPVLTTVAAQNTAGVDGKNAGDSLQFTFGEATTKPFLTATELSTTFTLNNSHSLLDGLGLITSESWNSAGTELTVVISGNILLPSVDVGDTVTMAGSLIQDMPGNSATGSAVIGGSFSTVDTTGPVLTLAVAADAGSNVGLGAGDTILLTFGEATNKPVITKDNIATTLTLNNGHTWLDGSGNIGSAAWNVSGTQLTITLSAGTSVPIVVVGDAVTVSGSVIKDVANNNATGTATITGNFSTVDVTPPHLTAATAYNTGSNQGVGAGDTVILSFDESTNKPAITKDNINAVLTLNNSHSWLDGSGNIGSTSWNTGGTMLTVTLSAGTSAPTVVVGDTVTVSGSVIKDAVNNNATGSRVINGNFGNQSGNNGDEDNDDDEGEHGACSNGLLNGRIYSVTGNTSYYLAAACRLKVFNGAAIGKSHGHKFMNIINLDNLNGLTVSASTSNGHHNDDHNDDEDDDEIEFKAQGKFKIKLFGNKGNGHKDD